MEALIEILKNQIIKIPAIKQYAKKFHVTGINQSIEGLNHVFDFYQNRVDFKNKNVIEIGPGHTHGIACKIKEAGANKISIIDIEKYISDDILKKYNYLDYIIYDGNIMPVKNDEYDLVISYTVFEHLRNPQKTISETFRILKKGGIAVHMIDLCDHMFYGKNFNPDKAFNCLKYNKRIWEMMSYNRSVYVNRLRSSEWVSLHQEAGFKIEKTENIIDNHTKQLFESGKLKYLNKLKPEDRFVSNIILVARK